MAWGWFDRKRQDPAEWTGFLEQGVKVEGRLESSGTFRIDSAIQGNARFRGHVDSRRALHRAG